MALTPLIPSSIPPRSFELIRDQIVAILATELASQHSLNNAYPNVVKVWGERFIPINSETETPTVNVSVAKGNYDNITIAKADGDYIYNIDIYTSAPSSVANGPGDQFAMMTMNKIVGMIWAILSSPAYNGVNNVLLLPGIIIGAEVQSFAVLYRGEDGAEDSLSDVVGRLKFCVRANETAVLINTGNALNESTATVLLEGSEYGFFYNINTTE